MVEDRKNLQTSTLGDRLCWRKSHRREKTSLYAEALHNSQMLPGIPFCLDPTEKRVLFRLKLPSCDPHTHCQCIIHFLKPKLVAPRETERYLLLVNVSLALLVVVVALMVAALWKIRKTFVINVCECSVCSSLFKLHVMMLLGDIK